MPDQRDLGVLHIENVGCFEHGLFVHRGMYRQQRAAVLQKLHTGLVILGQSGCHIAQRSRIGCHQLRHAQQQLEHAGGHGIGPQPCQRLLLQHGGAAIDTVSTTLSCG